MKIGLRTAKTAVSAVLAIYLANALGLTYAVSAGIMAVMSLTSTKRSSLRVGVNRLGAMALATAVSAVSFNLLGYNTIAFGVYLLLYIPLATRFRLSDGIVVCSVLVTHYLGAQSFALALIINEFAIMLIGVGCALLMNLYMPDTEKQLRVHQEKIEADFRQILYEMAEKINRSCSETGLEKKVLELQDFIRNSEQKAFHFQENQWFSPNEYYNDYFSMRRAQVRVLLEMVDDMDNFHVSEEHIEGVREILNYTAETFAEENDGTETLKKISQVFKDYQQMALPKTREEFENRAALFGFFQAYQSFIHIKAEFAQNLQSSKIVEN